MSVSLTFHKATAMLRHITIRLFLFLMTPWQLLGVKKSKATVVSDITYRWFISSDALEVKQLLVKLNNGVGFSGRELLYRFFGSRLVLLATVKEDLVEKIIGVNLYYFNFIDIEQRTVHEGFVGVHPNYRGRGVAPLLREQARKHLEQGIVLRGISTRISVKNKASMKVVDSPNAEIFERYWDPITNEARVYLIHWFYPPKTNESQAK